VIGHALSRVAPDSTVHREVDRAFADGTRVPDLLYDDFERTTYNSYSGSRRGALDYRDERSLDRRLRGADRLFCVVLGSEDELIDGPGAARDWRALPGARIALLAGAGHSPMVEDPAATARRIDRFATASSGTPPAESCPAG
jgi:pimeloyl-ACP methyl ester carboxylesterase